MSLTMKKNNVIELYEWKMYGECPDCGCDTFLLLMNDDDEIMGTECCQCRADYFFEEDGISFELDGG